MKIFTIEEANALLPQVRKIATHIQRSHRGLSKYRDEAKAASEAAERGGGGLTNGQHYAELVTALTAEMSSLDSLGVQLKDFDRGLVDFPYLRDGRVVFTLLAVGRRR
jgi:hypothetical protein